MGNNPDYAILERAYDVLDRLQGQRGKSASIEAARAMLQVGLDYEAGRCVVEKDGVGVRVVYRSARAMDEQTAGLVGLLGDEVAQQVISGGTAHKAAAQVRYKGDDQASHDPFAAKFGADQAQRRS